jgi:hypothetical protein
MKRSVKRSLIRKRLGVVELRPYDERPSAINVAESSMG